MKYFIGGVNASGKTTFLTELARIKPDLKVIKASQVFMDFLGFPGDYEKLRALPEGVKFNKLAQLMAEILAQPEEIILDSHYLNLVRGQTTRVTEDWLKNFDALILLKISPETAIKRINQDDRDRALFPVDAEDEKQFKIYSQYIFDYENEFKRLAEFYDLPHKVLDGEAELDQKVCDFLSFTDELKRSEF